MKIGFVVDDHMGRPGGVQEYVRGLRHELERRGHRTVIFSGGGGSREHGVVPVGISLPLRGSGSSTSIPLTVVPPWRLRRLLMEEACDVLHVMAPYSPTLGGRLLVSSRAAHVMTFLVAIEPAWYRQALGLLATVQRRSLDRFDQRIAISGAAARSGRALYGGDYLIVPVGVAVERFRPPDERPARDRLFTIVYVGRLERRKGVAHLLRAVARLERQTLDFRVEIGGDGPERAALERLASELGLRRVRFHGYITPEALPGFLHSGDVFCAPATYAESFGIVLVEAMAAGLPIVAAANAGYAEVLAAHPGNLLVPPGNDHLLAGALAACMAAPGYCERVGSRNLAASAAYSWQAVASRIESLYDAALTACPDRRPALA